MSDERASSLGLEPPKGDKAAMLGLSAPTSPQGEQPWYKRLEHGFQAPLVGLDLLASQVEQNLPFVPAETAKSDLEAAQKQKAEFEKQGSAGFSGLELVGNMLNPLNYLAGGPIGKFAGGAIKAVPTVAGKIAATVGNVGGSAVGRGAAVGASSELVQPDTDVGEDYWKEKGVKSGVSAAVGGAVGAAAQPLSKAISGNSPEEIDKFIRDKFMASVRPSVAKKGSYNDLDRYTDRLRQGIGALVANKNNLRLLDEFGQPAETDLSGKPIGSLPTTLTQFAHAIDQTKDRVYNAYNSMAKQAGHTSTIDTTPLANELQKIVDSKSINFVSPDAAKYAESLADRLSSLGKIGTEDAQQMVQHLNTRFNSSPTYDESSRAGVDRLVASHLREGLDKSIEKAVGPGYQKLKNLWGSLRTLERDVVKAAAKNANLGPGLMGSVGDVLSADEVIRGIVHMNMGGVATGVGLKAATLGMKHLRSPNRAIKRLFEQAEKGSTATPTRQAVGTAVQRAAPVGAINRMDSLQEANGVQ